jgi:hypothetical protein
MDEFGNKRTRIRQCVASATVGGVWPGRGVVVVKASMDETASGDIRNGGISRVGVIDSSPPGTTTQ